MINTMPSNELYFLKSNAEGATLFAFYPHSNMQAQQVEDGIGYYADSRLLRLTPIPTARRGGTNKRKQCRRGYPIWAYWSKLVHKIGVID